MANLDHVTGIGGKACAKATATLHRGMDRTSKAFAVAAGVVAAALSDLNTFPVAPARISRMNIFWARLLLLVFTGCCEGRLRWPPFAGQLRTLKSFALQVRDGVQLRHRPYKEYCVLMSFGLFRASDSAGLA